jgi:hypothetical protein
LVDSGEASINYEGRGKVRVCHLGVGTHG